MAGKSTIHSSGIVRAPVRIGRFVKTIPCLVVPEIVTRDEAILGEEFLLKEKVDLQYSKEQAHKTSENVIVYPYTERGCAHQISHLVHINRGVKGQKDNPRNDVCKTGCKGSQKRA